MASRVVLHVGLMKSGTSYVQQRLEANRDLLLERGVLLPGERWRDQVLAVSDVLGRRQLAGKSAGRWARLVADVEAHDGAVVVSMEFLGPARPELIARVVGSFGAVPVEVVVTLRDLGRTVPAMWQESLQNGGTRLWIDYVRLLDGRRRPAQAFWRQQGMGRIVDNWVAAVGPANVALVTVPPPGADPGSLWERFCDAAGLDALDAATVAPANTSLDAASAMVLRELNLLLEQDGIASGDYHRLVKFELGKRALAGCVGESIGFDPPRWLRERASAIRERLEASGARVVGDLGDLTPLATPGTDPDAVPATDLAAAAVAALSAVVRERAGQPSRPPQPPQPTTTSETP
ncbi:hypothetical protein NPS01_24180 [Nocardioides psychrotolerans]|uniref:Sulfotransferase family protein n=1 Tax=Nocardioides psychrotolerans TaxID=1005945 RepID=A0A1I3LAS3_9ACTN|nr:hypothetical protein [Nocardioides psychrotolerans]GEP38755.1 hypothetical protein NPS01_24180 [Nocardioides psychrotolerans]SFI81844.1 hypothetical protein SAMN05216561_11386 [Nocardioides psychrotolerans]